MYSKKNQYLLLLSALFGVISSATVSIAQESTAQESTAQTPAAQASAVQVAPTQTAKDRLANYQKHVAMKETSKFKDLRWQFLGPTNISGRVTDVAVETPRGKSYAMYVATASGGVWKTENEGVTWNPVFEDGPSTSIGDVTISPSKPSTVWIGTGEGNIFRSSMAGAGVFKSTDSGKTWKSMGLADTHTIPRILVHPTNDQIVYVAATGHEWTDNPERGLYKSTDGGESWKKILYLNERTGIIDIAFDPEDPETIYAASWQRIRRLWNDPRNEDGYDSSGIHKSTDGGKTWEKINKGLPAGKFRGRIGIDVCKTKPNVVYAFLDNYDDASVQPKEGELDSYGRPKKKLIKGAEVYRSEDKGATWKKMSEENDYMRSLSSTYGWVFGQIRVDPNNPEKIYVMGISLNVSEDGGKTFRRLRGMHGDHHALWIDPENSNYLVNGNDGGVVISYDGGKNWRQFLNNLPVVQFFNIGYDMAKPFRVYGSIQDHGSRRGVVDLGRGRNRIRPVEFTGAPGGEGSSHAIDPSDPDIVYSAGFYGRISRTNMETRERANLLPNREKGQAPFRGQWIAPFILSSHNPRVLYHGMNFLFRSMDQGNDLQIISPDLTHNETEKIGDISYQTLSSISESPLTFGVIYVGTDDGRMHMTPDSGKTWNNIGEGLAEDRWISRVEASRYKEGTVYITQNGKRNDDFTPYVWKSTNFGKTWTSIVGNIPSGPVNVIREDPFKKDVLYVGTDLGVYVSEDGGETWHVLANNLPTTFIHDLIIHPRDDIMVAATHGRGMYALDVRKIQGKPANKSAQENRPRRRRRDFEEDEDED